MTNRKLFLSDEITRSSVKTIIDQIILINNEDDENEGKLKDFERQPIELFLNTPGGDCDSGLALIGIIQTSKTPIHITVIGEACSMGIYILTAGRKRMIHKFSSIMYHDVSYGYFRKLESHKKIQDWFTKQRSMMDDWLISKTKLTRKRLDEVLDKNEDWFINAQEALELGVVDEIIE